MQALFRQPLDGDDLLADDFRDRRRARALSLAIDVHRAGSAQADAAAVLRPGKIELSPQHPEQRHLRLDVDAAGATIYVQLDHSRLLENDRRWAVRQFLANRGSGKSVLARRR